MIRKKKLASALLLALAAIAQGTLAQNTVSGNVIKIGVLTDMTSLFSDIGGMGSVTAAKMAVEDFGGKVKGMPIELVFADHQNKTDVAAGKAREWFDTQNVDAVVDLLPSSVALAVAEVARQKDKIALVSGAGTSRLTNENCSPNTVHYTYDTYALASNTVNALANQANDSWYFLTVDYALGASLEKDATDAITANKGKKLGSIRHPTNASDVASYLLQAQASGAKVIALANAGGDLVSIMKQADQFGLLKTKKQTIAGLHVFISDVHSMGLPVAQGMVLTTGFYWDLNDQTRKWSHRFFERQKKMPTMNHAGIYSSVMHYLKAIESAGTDNAATVMARMKSTPINDFFAQNGRIREDGRMVHDMYLVEVKSPQESKKPWDYYKVKATIPADQAFLPLSKSVCPLIKK
ncbi:ABC transporter substrate-binding protein [Noviherbaspirillum saxi]|uniref:ABC transporter substrate-binding protein n=1 Tax=Noviherbaspirillum saxi TaxID=2320863 RepID=A0A3A3FJL3_9BURK|nr:ABC transporter substrate-binding protein [Noviherbaspirillum saxi]RJF92578.1 ABC transporter substrate-binding protein [Noviherbaspirillum saxi]